MLLDANAVAVGNRLRALRGDRSLRSVAEQAGVSAGHLWRVEHGERGASLELLLALEIVLDSAPGTLSQLAPVLHPGAVGQLAATDLAYAVGRGDRLQPSTHAALRRLDLAAQAKAFLGLVSGAARVPIDPIRLAHAAGVKSRTREDTGAPPVIFDGKLAVIVGPEGTVENRFWHAHAIGHALLQQTHCDTTTVADDELDASALASFLLVPGPELARGLTGFQARNRDSNFWESTSVAELILAMASLFLVPAWLMARRLGEEGHLAWIAGVDER